MAIMNEKQIDAALQMNVLALCLAVAAKQEGAIGEAKAMLVSKVKAIVDDNVERERAGCEAAFKLYNAGA